MIAWNRKVMPFWPGIKPLLWQAEVDTDRATYVMTVAAVFQKA